jgi:hypothetical protein
MATECIILLFSVIGLFLNGLAVYITLFRYKTRNSAIYLIIFVAIIDILFSLHYIASQLAKWITSNQVLANPWFCQTTGMFFTLLIINSVDGIGILSLLRALSVLGNVELRAVYWYIVIGVLLILNTTFSIFGLYNNIMRLMPSEAYCQVSFRKSKFSSIYSGIMMGKFIIMMLIVFACYICITIKFYKNASQLYLKNNSSENCILGDRPATAYQRWIIIRLLVLVLMYIVCFVPELIILIYNLSTNTQRSPSADAIAGTCMCLTVVVNSVFVLFYHQEIRDILLSMIPRWISPYPSSLDINELEVFKV